MEKNAVKFILLQLLVICLGCTSGEVAQKEYLKRLIAQYNNAVVVAYSDQDFELLKGVASDEEFRKIYVIVAGFLQGNRIMEADIKRIDYKEIKIEGDKATVKTSEDWSYRWVNYRARQEVEPLKEIHYEMLYYLIKKDGKWLVDEVNGDNRSVKGQS